MVFPILGSGDSSSGYNIQNSLRLDSASSAYLYRDQVDPTSEGQIYTVSVWNKICFPNGQNAMLLEGGYPSGSGSSVDETWIMHNVSGTLFFQHAAQDATVLGKQSASLQRDVSAWYHFVMSVDTTDGTAANRIKIYINNEEITADMTGSTSAQNAAHFINLETSQSNQLQHWIGRQMRGSTYSDMYVADFSFVDGTQLTPSSFGEADEDTGIWKPKKPSVTWGDNGFFLEFKNSAVGSGSASTIGADTSGNSNHFTSSGVAVTDQTTDTPTNNFCTLNPLMSQTKTPTYLEGNTHFKYATGSSGYTGSPAEWAQGLGTVGLTAGKWYWEVEMQAMGGNGQPGVTGSGTAMALGNPDASDNYVGKYARGYAFTENGGSLYNNNSASSFGSGVSVGNVLMFALDMDNHKLYYGAQGTWQNSGDPTSGATGTGAASISNDQDFYYPAVSTYNGEYFVNFGNPPFTISSGNADANGYGNFEYAVPSGYYSICTKNLAEFGG